MTEITTTVTDKQIQNEIAHIIFSLGIWNSHGATKTAFRTNIANTLLYVPVFKLLKEMGLHVEYENGEKIIMGIFDWSKSGVPLSPFYANSRHNYIVVNPYD